MTQQRTATISFNDGSPATELPVLAGSIGPEVIDIRSLYAQTGKFTYDPGFMSTGSCKSAITYIDGDKGVLLYRGYPIEQLAEKCDFLEVVLSAAQGRAARPWRRSANGTRHQPAHHGARPARPVLQRASAAMRIRWR